MLRDELVKDAEDAALPSSSQPSNKSPPSAEQGQSRERLEQSLQDAAEAFILSQSQASPPSLHESGAKLEEPPPPLSASDSEGNEGSGPEGGARGGRQMQHGVKRLREEDVLREDEVTAIHTVHHQEKWVCPAD